MYKEGLGRHVIATDDIEAGEVIVSETPGVSFLHYTHRYTNCHHCLKSLSLAIPCPKCDQAGKKIFGNEKLVRKDSFKDLLNSIHFVLWSEPMIQWFLRGCLWHH